MLEHLLQLCERDGTFDNIYLYVVSISHTHIRTCLLGFFLCVFLCFYWVDSEEST